VVPAKGVQRTFCRSMHCPFYYVFQYSLCILFDLAFGDCWSAEFFFGRCVTCLLLICLNTVLIESLVLVPAEQYSTFVVNL